MPLTLQPSRLEVHGCVLLALQSRPHYHHLLPLNLLLLLLLLLPLPAALQRRRLRTDQTGKSQI